MHRTVQYHDWQTAVAVVRDVRVKYATKPGAFSHGEIDPAAVLLAERVRANDGDVVMHLNCGSGIMGAVAAMSGSATRVWLSDRNVISADAATRTMTLNGVGNATVFLGQGTAPFPAGLVADAVGIRLPEEKLVTLLLLHDAWRALRVGGTCAIAGATNEGARSAARLLERMFGNSRVESSAGGIRLVSAVKQSDVAPIDAELDSEYLATDHFHRFEGTLRERPVALVSRPGVFSWEHLDEATELLAQWMEVPVGASVLDLGCGTGGLGVIAAQLSGSGQVTMLDADAEAVRSATTSAQNAGLTNCVAMTSDIASAVFDRRFDVVVTNPPFHIGKATNLTVPAQFMRDAKAVLVPGGRLFVVANRTLPYEPIMMELFGNMRTLHNGRRFKVLASTSPVPR
jgi:16S rRNA (guanine1207-N2)-methyltransferase